ncbi:MAG: cohesin domain-containing protein [Candidatus Shapirobacteria bacterium]
MRKIVLSFTLLLLVSTLVLTRGAAAIIAAPHLTLTPSTGSYKVGDTVTVKVGVNSDTVVPVGVDVVGTFDSAKLEFVSVAKVASPILDCDVSNSSGSFDYGCVSGENSASLTDKVGDLFTFTFKAKAVGTGTLTFSCAGGDLNDSNIFGPSGENDNIVCSANSKGSYVISAASSSTTTTTSTSATEEVIPTESSELPKTGAAATTIGLLIFGLVSVAGAFLLKFL